MLHGCFPVEFGRGLNARAHGPVPRRACVRARARAVQATLDRPGLLAQALRDLADGELFEVAQQQHFEVVGGQRFPPVSD